MEYFERTSHSVLMHAIITKIFIAYCRNNNFFFVDNKKHAEWYQININLFLMRFKTLFKSH